MAIVFDANWKGSSNIGGWDNHESNLSESEMEPLAAAIINLPDLKNPGPQTEQCFKDLSQALQSGTVTVTKGIHQRDSKVHFDVKCTGGSKGTFHVFVTAGSEVQKESSKLQAGWGVPENLVGKSVMRNLFQYVVSGLSYRVGKVDYLFPSNFQILSDLEKPLGRERRRSLCLGNSTPVPTHIERRTLV